MTKQQTPPYAPEQEQWPCRKTRTDGQHLNEFAVILGLVAILGFILLFQFKDSLPVLMGNTSGNLKYTSDTRLSSGAPVGGVPGDPTGSVPGVNGPGGNGPSSPPEVEQRKFQLEVLLEQPDQRVSIHPYENNQGNTTSELGDDVQIDVTRSKIYPAAEDVYHSLRIAKVLQRMADEETDTSVKEYYQKLAKLSYYIGGTEGELDDLDGLDINPSITGNGKNYSNADAARDILNYSKQLKELIAHPPAALNHQSMLVAQSLGHQVWKVSQRYIGAFRNLLDENEQISENWSNDPECQAKHTCEQGGKPGLSLNSKKDTGYDKTLPIQGWQYDQLYPYDLLAARVNEMFAQGGFLNESLRVTLVEIAKQGEQTASTTP